MSLLKCVEIITNVEIDYMWFFYRNVLRIISIWKCTVIYFPIEMYFEVFYNRNVFKVFHYRNVFWSILQ